MPVPFCLILILYKPFEDYSLTSSFAGHHELIYFPRTLYIVSIPLSVHSSHSRLYDEHHRTFAVFTLAPSLKGVLPQCGTSTFPLHTVWNPKSHGEVVGRLHGALGGKRGSAR